MRKTALLAAVLLAAALPSVAHAQQPRKLSFILNFLAGGPQAGFIYAQSLGLYKQAGIDLTIQEGKGSATTAQLVATGQTDLGFADAPAAMQLRAIGAPVKIVAPILQTNGFAIISLAEENITKPADLIGKRLAVQPGTAQTTLLDAILAANHIDGKVNVVNIDPGALVGALLQKRVDAILAGADFQGVQIVDRGFKINQLWYRDVGVPTVGLAVVARDDRIQKDADLFREFIAVSLDGWARARANPEAAAEAVHAQYPSASTEQIAKQLKVDLELLCAPGATALGRVPAPIWTRTWDLLTTYLNLPKSKPVGDYYTDALLPADPPKCP
ncbi:MAG: ABC transporter substrate-binding protein [Acetobacteraceae bacterium]